MAKELVVYFSVYGTAKIVAEEIAKQTGADIKEIVPEVPYDSNRDHYNALARLAKKEHDENQRPVIKNEIDIDAYDCIYIGYPMWWRTCYNKDKSEETQYLQGVQDWFSPYYFAA